MKRPLIRALSLLAIGLAAGLLNGALGAGGGILLVLLLRPMLRSAEERRRIYPTALAVTLPLSALTLYRYWRLGAVSATSAWLLPPALVGGILGAVLLRYLPLGVLARIFSAVVLVSGILMVL